jgi:hypothetical protein
MRAAWFGWALLAAGMDGRAAGAAELTITLQVSGAVTLAGTYHHEQDGTHRCWPAVEVLPAPGPGGHFDNLPYRIGFDVADGPTAFGLWLELPGLDTTPGRHDAGAFTLVITVDGHRWGAENPARAGMVQTEAGGARGSFRVDGLHAADAPGSLSVSGEWTCPPPPF